MKNRINSEIVRSCSLCEHAKKIQLTGEILCNRSKNLKKVSDTFVCRKFSFDILSYRPEPSKIPEFSISSPDETI